MREILEPTHSAATILNKRLTGIVLIFAFISAGADEDEAPEGNNEEEEAKGGTAFADDTVAGVHAAVEQDEGKVSQDDANGFHEGVPGVEARHYQEDGGESNLAK